MGEVGPDQSQIRRGRPMTRSAYERTLLARRATSIFLLPPHRLDNKESSHLAPRSPRNRQATSTHSSSPIFAHSPTPSPISLYKMPFDDHVKRGHPIVFGLLAFFSFVELVQSAVLVGSCECSRRALSSCRVDRAHATAPPQTTATMTTPATRSGTGTSFPSGWS